MMYYVRENYGKNAGMHSCMYIRMYVRTYISIRACMHSCDILQVCRALSLICLNSPNGSK